MAFNKEKALKEAEKLLAKGKDREAIAVFKDIVKNDARDLNSLNKIGDLYLKLGSRDEALECFAQVAEKYASDGFNLRAIAMYKKCTRADPARISFHERLADLNAQQGLTNEARAEYQLVAEHHLKDGNAHAAREVYAKIAVIEPDNLKTRLRLADLYLKDNEVNLALGEYQVIGAELAKKGMLDESLQVLQKALALDPSNVEILRATGRTYADMGRAREGLAFIDSRLAERGGQDPDLLLVLGEIHQGAAAFDQARAAFDRALALAPARTDLKSALFRLHLARGDAGAAYEQYDPVADELLASGQAQQVVDDLKSILRVEDGHVATLERLAEAVRAAGGDSKVRADWKSKLAEAYISHGRNSDAERVLDELVAEEPEVAQHGEKLEFVRAKLRGDASDSVPAAPSPASDISFGGLDDSSGGGFSMAFDEGELDVGASEGDTRAEFINEKVAEADVFMKYGLVDKAVEQLQEILQQYPDDLSVRQRLKTLLLDEGRTDQAVEQCVAIAAALRQAGDSDGASEALAEARDLDPNHPGLAAAGAAAPAAASAPASVGFELGTPSPAAATPEAADAGGFAISFDAPAPPPAAAPDAGFEISMDEPAAADVGFEISMDEPAAADAGFEISMDEPAAADVGFEISMDEPANEPAVEAPVAAAPAAPSDDAFEISVDEAPAADVGFDLPMAAPSEPTLQTEAIVRPVEPAAATPVPAPAAEEEESLFGEEDDFFNFAEELSKELSAEETSTTEVSREQDQGMTLEQIISGMQAGVAKQVDPADYETHYNLGIAYKEMGLQDEAIGEFQYASKEPTLFLQCCILLGACFTEKGMPELAIKWYEKGKTAKGVTEEDIVALNFEIAVCHEALGDDEEAVKAFMDIYSNNARYRDVSARLSSLKQKLGK